MHTAIENAATRTREHLIDVFNRRDMAGFLTLMAADAYFDDRRKGLSDIVFGTELPNLGHALFETVPSSWHLHVEPIATRASRLSLTREVFRDTDDPDRPIVIEILRVTEVTDDGLVHWTVLFDPDDIAAAHEELDAQYVAGEGADHSHTWSAIATMYAAMNRHDLGAMAPEMVIIDHRPVVTIEPNDLAATLGAAWGLVPDLITYVEVIHRLSTMGAVVTNRSYGTSREGFDAEWRMVQLLSVDRDLMSRFELFDEADLDAALARFDQLNRGETPPAKPAAC